MAAFSYEAANTHVVAVATPDSSAYRGWRTTATRKPDGTRSSSAPYWAKASATRSSTRPGDVEHLAGHGALELGGEHHLPEPAPRLGVAVHERRAERPGAQRELEVEQRRDADAGAERRRHDLRAEHDPRLDREHEQADGRDQQQGQPVVRDRDAEHGRGQHDGPVGAAAEARIVGRAPPRRGRTAPSGAGGPRSRPAAPRAGRARRRPWRPARRSARGRTRRRRPSRRPAAPGGSAPTTTVRPTAVATRIADRRLIVNAGEPSGERTIDASQPMIVYAGNPVGCIVPRIGRTVWASPVSQAPRPGQQRRPVDGEHPDPDDERGDPREVAGAAARPGPATSQGAGPRSRPTG